MKMKPDPIELPKPPITSKHFILPILTLALLITIHLYLGNFSEFRAIRPGPSPSPIPARCDVFRGSWVFDEGKEAYYTNETRCVIDDRQNCMKYGRPDTEFMKWKWKPDGCELPEFDSVEFLEVVRGKSLAFVGDSVGRNQMQSLVCMLASSAAYPVDISNTNDTRFQRWLFPTHNFTLAAIWSPLLIKTRDPNPDNFTGSSIMNLYLDEADDVWTSQIERFDIVVFSAGQWFFRPFTYYEHNETVGCHLCDRENVTELTVYHAYGTAFRTAFRTLLGLRGYKGLTFLRTFSPQHFENGDYNDGGSCGRTRPYAKEEMTLDGYRRQMYATQVAEFRAAERAAEETRRRLRLRLLDTSGAMIMRPDGHPNRYGHPAGDNTSFPDCVHWCMPGPVDTWNEFLLEMLKTEGGGGRSIETTLRRNTTKLNLRR